MSEIRLYTQRINPFAGKVVGALKLKKLDYDVRVSDDPNDRKRWSPVTGQLPVLQIGDERRHDSNQIIAWLEERFPEPSLYASDPKTAATQRNLAEWADASFLFYWDRWRTARFPRPGDEQPVSEGPLDSVRQHLERWVGRRDAAPSKVELRELEVLSELSHRLDDLVGMLGTSRFFQSTTPCVADLSIYAMLRVIRDGPMLSGREMIEARTPLADYVERMREMLGEADEAIGLSYRPEI